AARSRRGKRAELGWGASGGGGMWPLVTVEKVPSEFRSMTPLLLARKSPAMRLGAPTSTVLPVTSSIASNLLRPSSSCGGSLGLRRHSAIGATSPFFLTMSAPNSRSSSDDMGGKSSAAGWVGRTSRQDLRGGASGFIGIRSAPWFGDRGDESAEPRRVMAGVSHVRRWRLRLRLLASLRRLRPRAWLLLALSHASTLRPPRGL